MIFVVELTTKYFVMHSLQNDKLKISVQDIDAELCEIKAVQQGTQFMWDANPKIWGSFAPNLFPIIGGLKHGVFKYNTNSFAVPKHGLIRHSKAIALTAKTATLKPCISPLVGILLLNALFLKVKRIVTTV
jgi:galactose mutarotase-like enzyme